MSEIRITVNGRRFRVRVPPMKRLLDVLREDCGLTGAKEGCGEGECGACTVLLDGEAVNSCLVPALQANGRKITTIEGLARGKRLSRLQAAFLSAGATQCGICTPGMLLMAEALARGRTGGRAIDWREGLAGNLCRCTGYTKILEAVKEV
ncbi:MAG: (2Fe-2S)-binding protein [Planctomycetes bacterium]|nr:(2Fe-2S)-binding protein [Planctomycetota bacterium]